MSFGFPAVTLTGRSDRRKVQQFLLASEGRLFWTISVSQLLIKVLERDARCGACVDSWTLDCGLKR